MNTLTAEWLLLVTQRVRMRTSHSLPVSWANAFLSVKVGFGCQIQHSVSFILFTSNCKRNGIHWNSSLTDTECESSPSSGL